MLLNTNFCFSIKRSCYCLSFSIVYCLTIVIVNAGLGDIAKSKCHEYGKAVMSNEDSPLLLKNPGTSEISQCGIVEVPLIIGGVEATPREFPHMAVIGYGSSPTDELAWHCGGSLISENFILTAAHCSESPDKGKPQKVRLGELNFKADEETEIQDRGIAKVIVHPEYKPPIKYNDIALIKLDSPVSFTGFVRPACLNTEEVIVPRAIATGFGKMMYDAEEGSDKLMKVTITFIDSAMCVSAYKQEIAKKLMPENIPESLLCAGELNGGKDTCQGDSGGPLQTVLKDPECMYSIVGVTSFGKFCGFKNSPAIYTKVSHYIPWIESNVW